MNNVFDFSRFIALIRRQWLSLSKIYLMSLGIVVGIFVLFYAYYLWSALKVHNPTDILGLVVFRPFVFIIMGLLFISVVASTYFSYLGDKSKAIFELLLPASSLEKFLVSLFYTVVFPIISYFFLFFVVDFIFVSYERRLFTDFIANDLENFMPSKLAQEEFLKYFFLIEFPKQLYRLTFVPILLSSLFLLGSIYFFKFHFIKTAISLLAYVFMFVFLMLKIMNWVTEGTITPNNNSFFDNEMNVLSTICLIGVIVTIIVWYIAYLRLKEKEI